MNEKLPIGTGIEFIIDVCDHPFEDGPDQAYARKGDTGEITGYVAGMYLVKSSEDGAGFGATQGTEFIVMEPIEPIHPPASGSRLVRGSSHMYYETSLEKYLRDIHCY